jgi:GT2 family glycosyltransferase
VICAHDLHVERDAFREMLDQLIANPGYGIMQPTVWQHEPKGPYPSQSSLLDIQWGSGVCLMLRRSAVEGINFDNSFGSYVEDKDFCLRVSDAGYRIGMATHAVGWELGSASLTAGVMVKANSVRLHAKRSGASKAVFSTMLLALSGMRCGLAACALWRNRERRLASRRQCIECMLAVITIIRPHFWSRHLASG